MVVAIVANCHRAFQQLIALMMILISKQNTNSDIQIGTPRNLNNDFLEFLFKGEKIINVRIMYESN